MNEHAILEFFDPTIQNPKSKIENWWGLSLSLLTLALCGAVVEAQQPKKVPG